MQISVLIDDRAGDPDERTGSAVSLTPVRSNLPLSVIFLPLKSKQSDLPELW